MTTAKKIDINGLQLDKPDDTQSLLLTPNDGLEIRYDLLTANPKTFKINKNGVNFTDNTNNFTTAPSRLASVQQAFQAVELPPNATTLEVNYKINFDDQVGNLGTIGLNGLNTELTATGDLILNPTGSISASGKTLDMTGGEIHKVPLIHGQNNVDLTIEGKGTGDLILKTGNTNRLAISDTGDWTINGGVGTSGQVLTSGGAGVSPSWTTLASGSVILPSWTTATRPSPPTNYQMGWNTSASLPEIYTGSTWASFYLLQATSITLSAGFSTYATIVYVDSANNIVGSPTTGGSTIYIFQDTSATTPGTTRTGTITPNINFTITYLVVAGGGGGAGTQAGGDAGGGGGAGGYLSGSLGVSASTAYTITAGAGGAGGVGGSNGSNGSNSVFATITATGGGGGGQNFGAGVAGGSGGGGGTRNSASGGAGTAGQGNNGGASLAGNSAGTARGGGGGGSGSVGADGTTSGNGGSGTDSTITGTSTTYSAGGGAGGYDRAGGVGTTGVSGNGAGNSFTLGGANGGNGTNGRGGGGGGSASNVGAQNGGNGGSGVVIIKFPSFA